jgi:hypothetical protein
MGRRGEKNQLVIAISFYSVLFRLSILCLFTNFV